VSATELAEEPEKQRQSPKVRSIQELREQERANIILALESTGWRVAGKNGAAQLLGMNSSTLNSRMRALGVERRR
jgi:transcriptional regulator with GAF, ATPase, and Fis domain